MTRLILPGRFSSQPQYAAQIDRANPLSRGLIDVFNPAVGPFFGGVAANIMTPITNPVGVHGRAFGYDGSGSNHNKAAASIGGLAEGTMLAIVVPASTTSTTRSIFGYGNSSGANPLFFIGQGGSSGQVTFWARDGASSSQQMQVAGGSQWANGTPAILVGTRSQSGNYHKLWINRTQLSSAAATTLAATTFDRTTVGGLTRNSFALGWPGAVYLVLAWNRGMSDAEVRELVDNPWQVFKAPERRIWVEPVVGGAASGVLAWTEESDAAALAATALVDVSASWAETDDVASIAAAIKVAAQAAWAETNDAASVSASVNLAGAIAFTEDDDAASLVAQVESSTISAAASWTESSDVASLSAEVTVNVAASWTEENDGLAIAATHGDTVSGNAAWTEANDTAAVLATVRVDASIGWAEASDTTGFSAEILASAGITWVEVDDSIAIAASMAIAVSGEISWSEVNDGAAITANSAVTDEDEQYPLAGQTQARPLSESQSYPLAGQRQTYPLGN